MNNRIALVPERIIQEIIDTQNRILVLLNKGNENGDELVSVKEAAKILKLSEQKIRQLIEQGELEHKRFRRIIRIYKSSLM